MDSKVKTFIYVHRQGGLVMDFKQYKSGLYYFDVDEYLNSITHNSNTSSEIIHNYLLSYSFIQTVEENTSQYTIYDVKNTEEVRIIYRKIGPPLQADYEYYLQNNFIRKFLIAVDDANRAIFILGPYLYSLTGKR